MYDEDEQVQGKNNLLRRGVLELDELVRMRVEWISSLTYGDG